TPTCVGTTAQRQAGAGWWPVHPHVRGDNSSRAVSRPSGPGSPPRAWGQRRLLGAPAGDGRFTPTCVGTTRSGWRPSSGSAVHPHVRGDNDTTGASTTSTRGSPPRAWGQRVHHRVAVSAVRFTPTCVGTTSAV